VRQPAAALRATKRVINMHLAQALENAVPEGFAAEARTMESDDHRRRIARLRTPKNQE
jgi:enoyl-CoA hydratase